MEKLKEDFDNRSKLWTNLINYEKENIEWKRMSLIEIQDADIEEKMKNYQMVGLDLDQKLSQNTIPDKVCEEFNDKISFFLSSMPVITAVSSTAMKDRHWKEVFSLFNINYIPGKTLNELSLGDLLDRYGINNYSEQIATIATAANAQERIMKDMEKIEKDWSAMKFQIVLQSKLVRDKFIIATVEEIYNLLDEHIQL